MVASASRPAHLDDLADFIIKRGVNDEEDEHLRHGVPYRSVAVTMNAARLRLRIEEDSASTEPIAPSRTALQSSIASTRFGISTSR